MTVYLYFLHATLKYIENNLEYLILKIRREEDSEILPWGGFISCVVDKNLSKSPYSKKPLLTCEILGCTPAYGFHSCLHRSGYVFVWFQEPMRYVVNMFCKNKWKKMLSKWKRSCLLWNRIHNQHCVSFLINVYYTSSKQRSKPKIVRKMSKFTYWHPTIACISKQCFKPC